MSFGKIFESMFTGSMVGSGPTVFAVWSYVIANARPPGVVEINPVLLAAVLGATADSVNDALRVLTSPDPSSRTKIHDGRRLLKTGEFSYDVPTWQQYRQIRNDDERRAYNREAQRRHRLGKRSPSMTVNDSQSLSTMSAQAEAEAEVLSTTMNVASATVPKKFKKPSAEEMRLHAAKIGLPESEVDRFWNYYESNGWKVGRVPMKSWTSAMVNWRSRWESSRQPAGAVMKNRI